MKAAAYLSALFFLSLAVGFWASANREESPLPPRARGDAESGPPPLPSPPEPAAPTTPVASLETVLSELPPHDCGPARAMIWGRVHTVDDVPVAGVRVEARPVPRVAGESSLEERVIAWAEEERASRELRRTATTDGKGQFELRELVRADYRIEAAHADFNVIAAERGAESYRPGSYVSFIARRMSPVDVTIDVIGVDGKEPREAAIEVRPARREDRGIVSADPQLEGSPFGRSFLWTPQRRVLSVGVDCELTARTSPYVASETVLVYPRDPRRKIRFVLKESRGILVEATYPEGCEKAMVRAAVMRIDPERPPSVAGFARGARWTDCHGDSARVATDIPPGTYMLGGTLGKRPEPGKIGLGGGSWPGPQRGGVVHAWTTVEVSEGTAVARLDFPAPDTEGGIVAWVYGPGRDLLRSLSFELSLVSANGQKRRAGVTWRRRADGAYVLYPSARAGAAGSDAEGSTMEVLAKHEELGEARAPVVPGETPSVTISLVEPGRLVVQVGGTDDPGLERHVRSQLKPIPSGPQRYLRASGPAEENRLEYASITPGAYTAVVTYSVGDFGQLELLSRDVVIESGRVTSIEVEVPELFPLEARVAETSHFHRTWIVGGSVRFRMRGSSSRPSKLRLPRGTYEVRRSSPNRRDEETVLLRFSIPEVDAIELPAEEGR